VPALLEEVGMPEMQAGRRSTKFEVRIVEEGSQIHMFFGGRDQSPIAFNRRTGRSGPRAYAKLSKLLDAAERRESQ
jgi:hypothetical protein